MFLGADPEALIISPEGPVGAHTRGFPSVEEGKAKVTYGEFFRDGFSVEMNPRPDSCRENLTRAMWGLFQAVKVNLKKGDKLALIPMVRLDLEHFFSTSPPPDCMIFGCTPSKNAYHPDVTEVPPIDAVDHPFRYAGGHMHFSSTVSSRWEADPKGSQARAVPVKKDGAFQYRRNGDLVTKLEKGEYIWDTVSESWAKPEQRLLAVKALDLFVTIPTIANGVEDITARARRRFYGRAGEYRDGAYGERFAGFEYRVPGPEMWRSPELASFYFGMARTTLFNLDAIIKSWDPDYEPIIESTINSGDVEMARLLMQDTAFAPVKSLPLLKGLAHPKVIFPNWSRHDLGGPMRGVPRGWGDLLREKKIIEPPPNGNIGHPNYDLTIKKVHWPSKRHLESVAA